MWDDATEAGGDGTEQASSMAGTDATYVRQTRQGMFDDATGIGSDGETEVKTEHDPEPRPASQSSGSDARMFPSRLASNPRENPLPQFFSAEISVNVGMGHRKIWLGTLKVLSLQQ